MSKYPKAFTESTLPSLWGQSQFPRNQWAELDILSLLKPLKSVQEQWLSIPFTRYASQVWRSFLPRRNSLLEDLPTEVLMAIFTYMDLKDILTCRKTSKRLFDISTTRSLWACMFQRLSTELMAPPILERPISAYSAQDLERIILKRISSEATYAAGRPSRVRTFQMESNKLEDCFHLLDGGRWLLMTSPRMGAGCVYAYDLDKSFPQEPQCIIDIGDRNPSQWWWIKADVDKNESSLTFNLCLVPFSTMRNTPLEVSGDKSDDVRIPSVDSPSTYFYVYRLTLKGHGSEATLVAQRLRTIYAGSGAFTQELVFQGHYLARIFCDMDSDKRHIEICNWFLSESYSRVRSYILLDEKSFLNFSILPGGKFLLVSDVTVALYDIATLHTLPLGEDINQAALQPYWCHEDPDVDFGVYLSKPYSDPYTNTTQIAIAIKDTIYGLILRQGNEDPCYQQLCKTNSACKNGFLGINKMYDISRLLKVTQTSFVWPGDEEKEDVLVRPAVHSVTYPVTYRRTANPLFDESSNRVFILGSKTWTIVDH